MKLHEAAWLLTSFAFVHERGCDSMLTFLQGPFAAMGMTGVTAVECDKTAAVANVSAELVRLGWGIWVRFHMCRVRAL